MNWLENVNSLLQLIVDFANKWIINIGPRIGGEDGEQVAVMVILLLGTGVYLTIRTGFVQITRLAHGFGVTSGKYDDPDDPGDVSHFQALTTALSYSRDRQHRWRGNGDSLGWSRSALLDVGDCLLGYGNEILGGHASSEVPD